MKRKEFVISMDDTIFDVGMGRNEFSCNGIDDFVGEKAREAYEKLYSKEGRDYLLVVDAIRDLAKDEEERDRRVLLLANFKEYCLSNKSYEEF